MDNIGKKESLTIEFKSDDPRLSDNDIVEVVVGFSNTEGGELYVGVEDDGHITGIHKDHKNPHSLGAVISNKTVPPVSVRITIIGEVRPCVLVEVPKSSSIVMTSSGKILKRRLKFDGTPETVPMHPQEVLSRLSNLNRLDYSAQPVLNATCDDLDSSERNRLRKIISSNRGEGNLLDLSDKELDMALRLVTKVDDHYVPTVTGLLLIGKENSIRTFLPTAEIAFQVIEGTDVRFNESFIKPLLSAFEMIEEYMKAWNPEREVQSGLFRIPISEFDQRAFREALVNAISHRDYTILNRVRFLINDEGLTINSPGGFIEGVTIENLLTVDPHGRNPTLTDALKRVGLAERTGRGIDRIYEGSLIYGRPWPDYTESNSTSVNLFIQRAAPDEAFTKMIYQEKNRLGRSLPINSLLILSVLKEERRADIHRIAELTHINEKKSKVALEQLSEAGLIEARGTGRGRTYMLSSKVYLKTSSLIKYERQRDIDSLRQAPLILQLAEKQGFVTRKDAVELLHLAEPQAYRVLKKLVEEDKLVLQGRGRGAKYLLKE
ncbi:hypothetical protein SDC9_34968 [bioreactor metagenome]|uniref:Schlafen AlbA-2 domain-containing protein n=1 Tax=bioreactor metagenome TaxID=1076179 RepID=A0A644VC61_9ZZZZ|nr:ATP-binding protein [Methanocorpusculum sp.]